MICPFCKADSDKVTDKRNWERNNQHGTRRRRECKACGKRFSTLEIVVFFGPDGAPILPGTNGHANGNGHKPAPKPQKALTAEQKDLKKKLAMALHRARCRAVVIEDEDLE